MQRVAVTNAVSILMLFTFVHAWPAVIRDDIRVLCQTEWRDDMLSKPAPQSGRTFDITLPLAEIPATASGAQLLQLAKQRAGVSAATDFINSLRVYRQSSGSPSFKLIDHRRLRDASPVAPALRAGDVVVFHGIVDRL
jgi:hypothetical protein